MNFDTRHLHGADLIETIRVEADGSVPLWPLHRDRLQTSANALERPLLQSDADAALARVRDGHTVGQTARWRLLLSADGKLRSQLFPLPPTPVPVALALAPDRLDSHWCWLQHKSTFRPVYQAAQAWLQAHPQLFDLLYLNERDALCEGSRCNLYLQDDHGVWLTPSLNCGVLPGVYRRHLLNTHNVREAVLSLNDLQSARAIRVSNALRGWLEAHLAPSEPAPITPSPAEDA